MDVLKVFFGDVKLIAESMRVTVQAVRELLEADRVITEAVIKSRGRKIVCKTLECACSGRKSSCLAVRLITEAVRVFVENPFYRS